MDPKGLLAQLAHKALRGRRATQGTPVPKVSRVLQVLRVRRVLRVLRDPQARKVSQVRPALKATAFRSTPSSRTTPLCRLGLPRLTTGTPCSSRARVRSTSGQAQPGLPMVTVPRSKVRRVPLELQAPQDLPALRGRRVILVHKARKVYRESKATPGILGLLVQPGRKALKA